MTAAGSSQEQQQAGQAEFFNEAEEELFNDFEEEEDDDEYVAASGTAGRRRSRGSASDRQSAVMNQTVERCYGWWGVHLKQDQPDDERRECQGRQQFLSNTLRSRPQKTTNTYFPEQEAIMEALPLMYEAGLLKFPRLPEGGIKSVEKAYLLTDQAMIMILDHRVHHKNLKNLVEVQQGTAAAAGSAIGGLAAAIANPFNHDDYPVGALVDILEDGEDLDEDGPEHQPLFVLATGRIKRLLPDRTMAGTKVYEVESVEVTRQEAFADHLAWLGSAESTNRVLTLQEELDKHIVLRVPVTNLRALDAGRDGAQATGATASLTKEAIAKMKLAELKLMCVELGLSVTNRRSKAPFQEALNAWVDEHGTSTAVAQAAAQVALKLSRYMYKNLMNAATDLQKTQYDLLDLPLPCVLRSYPRVQRWIQMFKRTTTMVMRRTVNDRQAGALPARPGEPEYLAMSENWLKGGKYEDMLYRGMFLEQMANAMRGSEVRGLELADRFTKVYDTVMPEKAVAVGSIKMNGKTNQNGQLMYYCHLRHADPRVCPVAADGLFQLWRFGIKGERFPNLCDDDLEDWMFLAVYPSASGGKMDYEEHRKHHREGLDAADCVTAKSTHMPRQGCADRIIAAGGTYKQALIHGHWVRDDPIMSYMNSPHITTMLLVAGFSGVKKHNLTWARLQPPAQSINNLFLTADGVTIDQQIARIKEVAAAIATDY